MRSLTTKQGACLRFLTSFIADQGRAPSYDEICHGMNIKSKSGAHRLLEGLEGRGRIRRLPFRRNAIEIVKPGERSDALAFLREDALSALRASARRAGVRPEILLSEICRQHFGLNPAGAEDAA